MWKKLSSHQKILYVNIKNVLTKKEKRHKNADKKVCDRTIEYYWKRRKCLKYMKGEVFMRYGKKNGKKMPKQRGNQNWNK